MKTLIGLMLSLLPVAGQVADYGRTAQAGASYDFRAATRTAPVRTGAGAALGACTVGDAYFQTDATAGQNLWLCTAADTWTQAQSSGGTGGAPVDRVSSFSMVDEFVSTNTSSTIHGDYGWTVSGGATVSAVAEANRPGILVRTTGSTASTVATSFTGTNRGTFHALDSWDWTWIFRLLQINENQTVRIGATCHSSVANVAQPSDGMYLECNAAECNGGNWYGVVRANSAETRVASGAATAANAWVKVRAQKTGANAVTFTVNGGTPFTVTNAIPNQGCNPWVMITNGAAASSYRVDLDFFQLALSLTR